MYYSCHYLGADSQLARAVVLGNLPICVRLPYIYFEARQEPVGVRYMAGRVVAVRVVVALIVLAVAITFLKPFDSGAHKGPLTKSSLNLKGVLLYHRYTSYSAWDSNLWMMDLTTGALAQVNKNWTSVLSPMNAHFSADGKSMVFMGSQSGLVENDWDVFISHWDGGTWAEPINLTGLNGKRDEDPKFSPNGETVIYKENGVLATMGINGSSKTYLTVGKPESSMPYFAKNGKDILFERNNLIMLLKDGQEKTLWAQEGLNAYYPIGMDDERYLFTQVQASRHDRLMIGYYDGREAQPLFFNSDTWDTSDPYPYEDGKRYIFYVSGDVSVIQGGYNLMVADLKNKVVASMGIMNPEANSNLEELGPAWSANGKFPKN